MSKIPLHGKHGEGRFALVDSDMKYLLKYRWILAHNGYVYRYTVWNREKKHQENVALHNEVMGVTVPDRKNPVDHINRDPLDNRRKNLRIVSISVNLKNANLYRNNTTGYRYVYRADRIDRPSYTGRFLVVYENKQKIFDSLEEAAAAAALIRR